MRPKEFECPRKQCIHKAVYYGNFVAACPIHGRLLYTEIPFDLLEKNERNGWMSLSNRKIEKIVREVFEKRLT